MNKSESIKCLAAALISFHSKVNKIGKDATNPYFKSKYASLSNILEVINTPLIESGLCFSQFPDGENGLTTILIHSDSGEYMQSTYEMKPVKDDPQGRGSALTYQRRYALSAILGLNIDEDDDANKASGLNGIKTTSHNQKEIEKNGLPLISNAQYKKLFERVQAGEIDIIEKAKAKYSFEPAQLTRLENLLTPAI